MQVREKIEMSGRDARWEFPKQLLFSRTNYMAEICTDLIEMVEIVDDFFKFLGPELKAVTGASRHASVAEPYQSKYRQFPQGCVSTVS
jgi:hypothetical protein